MIEDWIEQCKNGKTSAYAKVVQELQHGVLDYLYRMTQDWQWAEDLGQEAFLRAYRKLHRYDRGKAAFSTWLYRIARNLCLDELRKQRANLVMLEEAVPIADAANPLRSAQESQMERKIAEAVTSLPPDFREVFVWKEYRHLPLDEIAEITGVPAGTVKSRLHRARLMLQEKLAAYLAA